MNIILAHIQDRLLHVAKAVVALAVPLLVTAGFAVLDDLANADLPPTARLVVTVLSTALAVYRTPNAPKP